ncbi:MAG: hypothetical protein HOV80_39075 [Polyangiaceae bacterium]|nr:hypothetical protein [Polyangiaceae bacterium]
MKPPRAFFFVALAALTMGCEDVCEEVAEEAEASGCAQGLPEDDGELPEAATECKGQREQYAQCLLDFTDNVCFITDEERLLVEGCMNGEGS